MTLQNRWDVANWVCLLARHSTVLPDCLWAVGFERLVAESKGWKRRGWPDRMTAQAHTRSLEAQGDCKGCHVSPRRLIDIDVGRTQSRRTMAVLEESLLQHYLGGCTESTKTRLLGLFLNSARPLFAPARHGSPSAVHCFCSSAC